MKSDTSKLADARGGCPSASRMTRIFNCPASFRLNAAEMPETSEVAQEGTMLHRYMELLFKKPEAVTDEEKNELLSLIEDITPEQEAALGFCANEIDRLRKDCPCDMVLKTEERLWAKSGLFSGRADAIILEVQEERATVVDYKFGRGAVEAAEYNYQLAALAVLVSDNYKGISAVRAVIIQPRALDKSRRITECEYSKADIDAAREAINAACKEAIDAETPTQKCGYWCKYCPSAYRCKAAQDALNVQFKIATASPSFAIGKHNALDMFNKAVLVKNFCEAVLEKIKTFIANNPDADCGLELTKGARRAKLGNTAKVFDAVCGAGIAPEEFVEVCKVESGKLLSLYYNKRKLVNEKITKKASDAELKSRLESKGLLTYMEAAPTLKLLEDRQ